MTTTQATEIEKMARISQAAKLIAQIAYENEVSVDVAKTMILVIAERKHKELVG
jgi:hypothetical protein